MPVELDFWAESLQKSYSDNTEIEVINSHKSNSQYVIRKRNSFSIFERD